MAVGSLVLPNPVMTASGTAGHADELEAYGPLAALGAVVVKSLSVDRLAGQPGHPGCTRRAPGMLNSVGLQGPGIGGWVRTTSPAGRGRGPDGGEHLGPAGDDYAGAAGLLADVDGLTAIEVNVSCPNLEDRRRMFAHSPAATAEVRGRRGRPRAGRALWAKLSPMVADVAEVGRGGAGPGAEAVTLVNTALAMAIDTRAPRPGPRFGTGRRGAVGSVDPSHRRARRVRRAGRPSRRGHHRRGGGDDRARRGGTAAGRGRRRTGRDGDVPDPRAPWRVLDGIGAWCAPARGRTAAVRSSGTAQR